MIEIEKYSCADSNEARKRERELMEQFNCNLNTNKSYTTLQEIKNYHCNYYKTHQNEFQQYRSIYHPIYRAANREIINAKQREKRHQQKLASLNLEN
jgi:hypothetical protein